MKLIIVSDIHANLSALTTVFQFIDQKITGEFRLIHLGDLVDYGMRPNETIELFHTRLEQVAVNLCGNHEQSILTGDRSRYSSQRGVEANEYTASILNTSSIEFIKNKMSAQPVSLELQGRKLFFVHGSYSDFFWGSMSETEKMNLEYQKHDFVFSGHSHVPMLSEFFYKDEVGKTKKTTFLNPGSVGQPRNRNPHTQFMELDLNTGSVFFHALSYDVVAEMKLYKGEIDSYYGNRLLGGM